MCLPLRTFEVRRSQVQNLLLRFCKFIHSLKFRQTYSNSCKFNATFTSLPESQRSVAIKSLIIMVLTITTVLLALVPGAFSTETGHWQAGVSKVIITPREPVWMAGYASRNGPSDGVLVDLFARALVLSDTGKNRLVVVTMDLIEIPESLRELLVTVARKKHGIKPEELLLNVSHTHGGPMVSAKTVADWGIDSAWGSRADHYVSQLVNKVDEVIGKALSSQKAAKVGYCHARCGFAMNRRVSVPGGSFRLGPNPDGPVDHDVPVLRIESLDNQLMGLVFGYACHNTALSDTRKLNGDYAGFAQRKLEKDHPETVALFLMGCGGDQDPSPRRHLEDAEQNGLALASAVEGALVPAPLQLNPAMTVSMEMCPLPFAPLPTRAILESRAKSADGFVSRHARWVLQQWPKPGDHPKDYLLPVQVVVLGQKLILVALGGEPVVDYSIRLKKELGIDQRPVWVAGYSNLVHAYVPSRRVLLEGGYEGNEAVIYQSLPGPFAPELEDKIVESVHRQVKQSRENAQAK